MFPTPKVGIAGTACALLAIALAQGCATAPTRDQRVVKELEIEGTKKLSQGKIKDKILTTEPTWPWDVEIFDPNAWQADLRRIQRYYETQGYYQAQVVEDEVLPEGKNGVKLRVKVSEGEPTHLSRIRITGLRSLTPEQQAAALDGFPLKEGEVFKQDEWAKVKPLLRSQLREMGFAEAEVEGTVEVDVDTHLAQVSLEAIAGQRYRFGDIFVATDANPKVPPKWIIQEARSAIHKGQWYSESALSDAQARVFKLGVFGGVKVNRGAADRAHGTVPVVIDVREAPFRTLRAGGGLGVDQSRQEVRALAEYSNRNFFGGLRLFTAKLRAGYAFLPSVFDIAFNAATTAGYSAPVAQLELEFSQPRVLLPSMRAFANVATQLDPEPAYYVLGGQAKTGLAWQPVQSLIGQLSYNFEAYHFLRGAAQLGGTQQVLALGCKDPCILSYLEAQAEWDQRARMTSGGLRLDPVDPAQGYYLGLSVQLGGGPLGGQFAYARVMPEARYYFSILESQRLTFAFRARAGTLLSNKESPIVSRFYIGGGNSMRGYNNRRLSPLLLVRPDVNNPSRCTPDTPGTDPCQTIAPVGRQPGDVVPIGGERMFEGSAEARYRFNEDFAFALFYDTGFNNLAEDPPRDIGFGNAPGYFRQYLQSAVGFGLRYITLVGPIRVDLAYRFPWGTPPRVHELPGDFLQPPPGGGCFGLGQKQLGPTVNPEGHCTLHISIGEAF